MKKITIAFSLIISTIGFAQLDDTSSTNNGAMTLGDGTGTLYQFAGDQRGTDTTNQSQGGFGILSGSHQISPIVWMYGNTNRNAFQVRKKGYNATVQNGTTLFHVGANGNVGIGTTDPSEKLHVNGNILSNKLMLNDPNFTLDWNSLWQSGFYESLNATNGPESGGWFWGLNMNHRSNSSTYKYNGQIAIKNSNTSPTMYFRSTNEQGAGTWGKIIAEIGNKTIISGNVGIGTANPSEKLTVKGKILCGEVEVVMESTIPADYVFQKYYTGASALKADYVMPSLEEVEAFTKANHHLPEIPSAATIKEEGLQLKEMTTLLLQKVEELTLYTIEQEKRIKSLETKLVEKN